MKRPNNISDIKQGVGIIVGIIAALVILVSQSFYYDYLASADITVKTEIAEDAQDGEATDILTISKDAVTTVVQFTISQTLQFITELQLSKSNEVEMEVDQKVELGTFFKTLFRLIISPNAP